MKIKIKIIFSYLICHLISYFILSVPYYHFVMKSYYIGEKAVFHRFLVTENQEYLWAQVLRYILPVQILSAILFAIMIVMVFDWLKTQTILKSFFFLFWCKTVISGILSISPAPGSIEGVLFFMPAITPNIHILVTLEMILQGIAVASLFMIINYKNWIQSE